MNLDEGLLRGADVLVVDDEPADVALIEQMLNRNGFSRITTTTDPRDFRAIFLDTHPDIVLLDLHMPHMDALDLLGQVQELRGPEEYLPVLVLSDDTTPRARIDALGAGAVDFLAKPLDTTEVGLRVLNYLQRRRAGCISACKTSAANSTTSCACARRSSSTPTSRRWNACTW